MDQNFARLALERLMDAAPDYVVHLDADLRVVRAGQAYRDAGLPEGSFTDGLDPFTGREVQRFFTELRGEKAGAEKLLPVPEGSTAAVAWSFTPVKSESGDLLGYLGLGRPTTDTRDGKELRDEVERLRANEERRVLEMRRLRSQVESKTQVDELTGLGNRHFILERLETELPRAIRYDEPLTILTFDIDHLARVNDDYGQAMGDEVLKKVADVVREQIRATDMAARFDGEQFMVLCPHTDRASSQFLAERLRRRISELTFQGGEEEFGITIGTGIVTVRAGNEFDVEALLHAAEEALQAAKIGGVNRIQLVEVS
jgi:diguanylate cyclase (GGDEF)-like protein